MEKLQWMDQLDVRRRYTMPSPRVRSGYYTNRAYEPLNTYYFRTYSAGSSAEREPFNPTVKVIMA